MKNIDNSVDISSKDKNKIKFLKLQIENNKQLIDEENIINFINKNVLDTKIGIVHLNIKNIDIIIKKINKKLDIIKNIAQYNVEDVLYSTKLQETLNHLVILKTIKNDENTLFKLLDNIVIT